MPSGIYERKTPAWNKGVPWSEESKEKMRQAKLRAGTRPPTRAGTIMSPSLAAKLHRSGSDHWNWQGGKTTQAERIRKSTPYKAWRTAVFERDDYTCVLCGVRGGVLNADHIKPFALHTELRLDVDNGRTLCVPCHRATDTFGRGATYRIPERCMAAA